VQFAGQPAFCDTDQHDTRFDIPFYGSEALSILRSLGESRPTRRNGLSRPDAVAAADRTRPGMGRTRFRRPDIAAFHDNRMGSRRAASAGELFVDIYTAGTVVDAKDIHSSGSYSVRNRGRTFRVLGNTV